MIDTREYHWYALYVKYRMERIAVKELEAKGIEVFLPLRKVKKQWSDRIKVIEEPLLTGYLFVKVSRKEYQQVLLTKGIIRYICFEGKAVPIPDYQINDLRLFVNHANDTVVVSSENVKKGQFVKVSNGELKGFVGEVVEFRGKTKLLLRINSLGCFLFAEMGTNKVEMLKN